MLRDAGLQFLVGLILIAGTAARGAEPASSDEELLKAAGIPTDAGGFLAFFHLRCHPEEESHLIPALIQQLGSGTRTARDLACGRLVALGTTALPLLRQAAKDPDEPQIMARAQRCLDAIGNPALPAAAVRLVGPLGAAGTAQVLLEYLPFADDESVVDEVQSALVEVARRKDRVDRDLLSALTDPVPVRRAAAAVAFCQGGGRARAPLVRKLLHDPKPTVRLRVALALGALDEEEAIPALIALLGELPAGQGKQALDFLVELAGEEAPAVALGKDPEAGRKCRDAWAAWWQSAKPAELVVYFQKRTLADEDRERILTLIRQLGDDAFEVREKATSDLIAAGSPAAPLLRQAVKSKDVEVVGRAQKCLKQLAREKSVLRPAIAARLLAVRKPPDASETLLGYLPFADDEAIVEAVQNALAVVALRDGKPDPAVLRALSDKLPARRAAAAETICKTAQGDLPAVRPLLKDPDSSVRLRAALALAGAKEREAIPVLIDLAADASLERVWQAQEFLLRLAGDQPPTPDFGSTPLTQGRAHDAWMAWWQANAARLDLGKLEGAQHPLGYTLVVQADIRSNTGRVGEWGPDRNAPWEISGLRFPTDAQVLPGNRVLLTEQHGMLVSERDFKGKILWQKPVNMPINCQRLPSGNTFIASRNLLMEVDRNNKEVFSYSRPAHDVLAAYKLRDGQIVCLNTAGMCLRLDAKGKEVGSFMVGATSFGGLDVLPNGRVLVAQQMNNRVVEFNADGKEVWQAPVAMPSSATRLPNGHTLVASLMALRVVELDRAGKIVWEMKTEGRPLRARRR